jgi:MutS family domain IV
MCVYVCIYISLYLHRYIRDGYNSELDELRELNRGGKKLITKLQAEYRETTGISTLKIRRNHIFGYFVEVTASHVDKLSDEFTICRVCMLSDVCVSVRVCVCVSVCESVRLMAERESECVSECVCVSKGPSRSRYSTSCE